MSTFAKLTPGVEFEYHVDADGHEPTLVKLNTTQAIVIAGSNAGLRETIAPDEPVFPTGKTHVVHSAPTDIERCALTILSTFRGGHWGLVAWIRALIVDPEETRDLDEWLWETPCSYGDTLQKSPGTWATFLNRQNQAAWTTQYDQRHSAFTAIIDGKHGKTMYSDCSKVDQNFMERYDEAVLRLAQEIVDYRVRGRMDGDYTFSVYGLLNVSTSLAAAVAEFHARVVESYCAKLLNLRP